MFSAAAFVVALLFQQPVTTGIVAGRVYDANREPVAGAYVQLLMKSYDVLGQATLVRPASIIPVRTDERGEYRFKGVPPGNYYIRSLMKGGVTYYPGIPQLEAALPVELRGGIELSAIDFTQAPPSPLKITGKIVDRARQGHVTYEHYLVRQNVRFRDADESVEDEDSSVDGFEFRNVEPGSYALYIGYIGDAFGSSWGYAGHIAVDVVDRDVGHYR